MRLICALLAFFSIGVMASTHIDDLLLTPATTTTHRVLKSAKAMQASAKKLAQMDAIYS